MYLDYLRGQDGSDYINASFIDSYHSQKAFIASQSPLQNTVNDFWRMLWRYKAPVVIMLTKLMEKGAVRNAGKKWGAEWRGSSTLAGVEGGGQYASRGGGGGAVHWPGWSGGGGTSAVPGLTGVWCSPAQERSACYWPSEANRPVVYGGHVVEMTAERDSGHYVYRDLYLTEKEVSFS